ncbi:peptidase [Paracoccus sanguinis]|uniref:peptidase n=1 Tax=Paracoccus sanguinis TaxID=1545044 RepID=UPI003145629B
MTYCVGVMLDRGLVFMSDTRTNAGVDNVSVFCKTRVWTQPGERTLVLMTAGNLATTQAVVGRLEDRTAAPDERGMSLLSQPSMFATAQMLGDLLRDEIKRREDAAGQTAASKFSASMILGGQIAGAPPRLFLIYPEGNFIEATPDTPFFQIGETKYGRPIIVRAYRPDMSFREAVKLLTVSFDSTIKANLSVGLPVDVTLMARDSFATTRLRMGEADPYYSMISSRWGQSLAEALNALPDPELPCVASPSDTPLPGTGTTVPAAPAALRPGAEAAAAPPAERGTPAPAEAVEVNPTVSVPVNDDPAAAGLAEPAPTAPGGPRPG